MQQPEILKEPETRDEAQKQLPTNQPAGVAFERIKNLIRLRRERLQSIRKLIALKSANLIEEKIDAEEQLLNDLMNQKKKEVARQNVKQSLPKEFFEQHYLKMKAIRID